MMTTTDNSLRTSNDDKTDEYRTHVKLLSAAAVCIEHDKSGERGRRFALAAVVCVDERLHGVGG